MLRANDAAGTVTSRLTSTAGRFGMAEAVLPVDFANRGHDSSAA